MVDYRVTLSAAKSELRQLRALRQETDKRIAQLERTIDGLAALCGDAPPEPPKGLTDACRATLQATTRDLTPTEVREALRRTGFDLTKYANQLAVIHTTLKRLAEQGEATIVLRDDDTGYRWTINDPEALAALRNSKADSSVLKFLDGIVKKKKA